MASSGSLPESLRKRKHVSESSGRGLAEELKQSVDAGPKLLEDPIDDTKRQLKTAIEGLIGQNWAAIFDVQSEVPERSKALDLVMDMESTYAVLGSKLEDIVAHAGDLVSFLLNTHKFDYAAAIKAHDTYHIAAMTGKIAAARNKHIASVLSIDPVYGRTAYSAVSMFLLPNGLSMEGKDVKELPMPLAGTNARKSELANRAHTLLSCSRDEGGLKEKLMQKGYHFKKDLKVDLPKASSRNQPEGAVGGAAPPAPRPSRRQPVGGAGGGRAAPPPPVAAGKAAPKARRRPILQAAAAAAAAAAEEAAAPGIGELANAGLAGVAVFDPAGAGDAGQMPQGAPAAAGAAAVPGVRGEAEAGGEGLPGQLSGADRDRQRGFKIVEDPSFDAWLFCNARVTFEGLIDSANQSAVAPSMGCKAKACYITEEASISLVFPGQPSKSSALEYEEMLLFADGTASKIASGKRRTLAKGHTGGMLCNQISQVPAMLSKNSGRNPTKRFRIVLNNDALTTDEEGLESRVGAPMTACRKAEVVSLEKQMDLLHPDVTLVDGDICVAGEHPHPRPLIFESDELGKKLLILFWKAVCQAINKCRQPGPDGQPEGSEIPSSLQGRLVDHFTDSLGQIRRLSFKTYLETVSDAWCVADLPGMPTISTVVPHQFILKAIVEWAREAVDVSACFSDALGRRAPAAVHHEIPALERLPPPPPESKPQGVMKITAEELFCFLIWNECNKINENGQVVVQKLVVQLGNKCRTGLVKEAVSEFKWANRTGVHTCLRVLIQMGVLGAVKAEENGADLNISWNTDLPQWIYSISMKKEAECDYIGQYFLARMQEVKSRMVDWQILARSTDALNPLFDFCWEDWFLHLGTMVPSVGAKAWPDGGVTSPQQLPAFEEDFLRQYRLEVDQGFYPNVEPTLIAFSAAFLGFWCSDPTRVAAMHAAFTKDSWQVIQLAVKDFFSAPLDQFLPTQGAEEDEEELPAAPEAHDGDEDEE